MTEFIDEAPCDGCHNYWICMSSGRACSDFKLFYDREESPRIIEKYYFEKDEKAIQIYNDFGKNFGKVLSHVINMLDPQIITLGGGLSKAFNCFKDSMYSTIERYSPSFKKNKIIISSSKHREVSTMIGACIMVKNKINFNV